MFSDVSQQISNRISMVARYAFDAAYTVFFHQMLAYGDYLGLRQMFMIEGRIRSFDKPLSTVIAIVLFMPCRVLASL